MRAGPLSNRKVIDILNRSFVPVYTVNEDYAPQGSAPTDEKAERERIFKQGYERHWSVGTVHVYVLGPDGQLFGTLHVAQAAQTTNLIALLERTIAELKTPSGQPVALTTFTNASPSAPSTSLWSNVSAM